VTTGGSTGYYAEEMFCGVVKRLFRLQLMTDGCHVTIMWLMWPWKKFTALRHFP